MASLRLATTHGRRPHRLEASRLRRPRFGSPSAPFVDVHQPSWKPVGVGAAAFFFLSSQCDLSVFGQSTFGAVQTDGGDDEDRTGGTWDSVRQPDGDVEAATARVEPTSSQSQQMKTFHSTSPPPLSPRKGELRFARMICLNR